MKLRPLHDWAVIRPAVAEEITEGGLYIPDTAKEKPHEGVVEEIGPGAYEEEKEHKKKDEKKERRFIPTTVKPGDRVFYEQYAGRTYKINGEERILVRERDILGILPERPVRSSVSPRPLQIPAVTSSPSTTMLVQRSSPSPVAKTQESTTVRKTAKKPSAKPSGKKKAVKKAVKKMEKKSAKKSAKRTKADSSRGKKAGKKK